MSIQVRTTTDLVAFVNYFAKDRVLTKVPDRTALQKPSDGGVRSMSQRLSPEPALLGMSPVMQISTAYCILSADLDSALGYSG